MNLVDVLVLVVFAVALVAGWNSGLFPQLLGLVGAALGGIGLVLLLPYARDRLSTIDPSLRAVGVLTALLVAVALGEAIGSSIGGLIGRRIGRGILGGLDKVAGALIGLAQAVLVVWLIGGALAAGPVPRIASLAQRSVVIRAIAAFLPPPTSIVGELGRWLDATGLQDVFIGLEPFPAAPVDQPSDSQAEQIARAARASTVEVRATGCDRISTGTGFVVGQDGYVVTNAHVVGGASTVVVGFDGGSPMSADVVLFDPEMDVALLHASALHAPTLVFSTSNPPRATMGAALGHPGGAPLQVIPAGVTSSYPAVGRDIYGTGQVSREIVELRAAIAHGDSGGPLVLADGTVGGVVYAEALSDPTVGYALGPVAVAARVIPSVGRTTRVSTGDCVN